MLAAPDHLDASEAPPVLDGLCNDLARVIEALAEPFRTVLTLRDMEQLTVPEAAAVLGVTPEALKSWPHRARAEVHKLLAGAVAKS